MLNQINPTTMKKQLFFFVICFVFISNAYSQVGIGTTNPQAQLDVRASNQATPLITDGILIPKVNNFPPTIPTAPQDGMLIYVTGLGTPTKGFYYWDDDLSLWVTIDGAKKIDDLIDGKSDNDGSEDGSSVFLGLNAGLNDNSTDNKNVGVGYNALTANTTGYQNTAVGYDALSSNISGHSNSAMGFEALASIRYSSNNAAFGSGALKNALFSTSNIAFGKDVLGNTTNAGSNNIALGIESLYVNRGDYNIGIGTQALYSNTSGDYNIGLGAFSLQSNTTGDENTALGYRALEDNIDGYRNTAIGSYALRNNTSGFSNVALSNEALSSNTTGDYNLAIGSLALGENTTGNYNIAFGSSALRFNNADKNIGIGYFALNRNTDGTENIAIGEYALTTNTTGDNLIAIGNSALENNTTANNNVAVGVNASQENTTGFNNTAIGVNALTSNQTGDYNVIIGKDAGYLIRGNRNVIIGSNAGRGSGSTPFTLSGSIFIGYRAGYSETSSNRLYIENSSGTTPLIGGTFSSNRVGINRDIDDLTNTFEVGGTASKSAAGDWLANSDGRLKKNILNISGSTALSRLTQLKGVSYYWNDTQTGITRPEGIQYGFIAQDLMKVFPEHVTKDNQGFYQTAYGTYDAFYVEAIKELNNQLDNKDGKIKLLEARLKLIEKLLLENQELTKD